jgi:hypothetical protein
MLEPAMGLGADLTDAVPPGERRGVEQNSGGAATGGRLVSHALSLDRSFGRDA